MTAQSRTARGRSRVTLVAVAIAAATGTVCGRSVERDWPANATAAKCIQVGEVVDSAKAVQLALRHFAGATLPRATRLVVLSAVAHDEGYLVSIGLDAAPRIVVGGGGLLWVDVDTGCIIWLRRYE
jgi:hypothetical protein